MTQQVPFTVIIPAHNEEAVIARCLEHVMPEGDDNGTMQVIVAANGCRDRTVQIARDTMPDALVLDLAQGSKTAAMNAANREARHFPRIYLDADVRCNHHTLAALARALCQPGVMAASPALRMDLSRSNALVRSYYRVWLTQPYVTQNMVGSGCFGLSQTGYDKIGDFPSIIGDDFWVYSRFAESEKMNITHDENGREVFFTVSPPRWALDQIRVETRRMLGNREVRRLYPSPHSAHSNSLEDLRAAHKKGASFVDLGIYLGMKAITRGRAAVLDRRQRPIFWERDLSSREA